MIRRAAKLSVALFAGFSATTSGWACAADAVDAGVDTLDPVTVTAHGVSDMTSASAGDLTPADLAALPALRPAAILENVPGLVVTQHSGEGKANQYFLRAFNLDHGTDFATYVDGMPVNMPTHAHGQGYSDLNFLIPETVGEMHYRKGPYYADTGDFSAAGSARIALADRFASSLDASVGGDGYRRLLALGSTDWGQGALAAAAEAYHNDGPFERPDDYRRQSLLVRYSDSSGPRHTSLTFMHYDGQWNSTDQVAEHLIDDGVIDRFGTVAPTDGGRSHRDSVSFALHAPGGSAIWDVGAYLIDYGLDLYSTFTDHLVDVVNGDQMLQHDRRQVYGARASMRRPFALLGHPSTWLIGLEDRTDRIGDVGIDHTVNRVVTATVQRAAVTESALGAYVEEATDWTEWLRTTVAARGDGVDFSVRDRMVDANGACSIATDPLGCNTGSRRAALLSPKFGLSLGNSPALRGYLNVARGFHSNDARGVTRSGENPDVPPVTALTSARSAEVGVVSDIGRWRTAVDVYELKLGSELVFSGDAGVTEPSGATTRRGVEVSERVQLADAWHLDVHGAYSLGLFDQPAPADDLGCGDADPAHPCRVTPAIVGREIPNSPHIILSGALTHQTLHTQSSLHVRYFGESPLVEDGSIHSSAYTTVDARFAWHRNRWQVGIDVFNLTNARWNDITYYYALRHPGEAFATPDYVIHPGTPRTIRLSVRLSSAGS